jgi:predicted amidohydrolase YtcJ
MPPTRTACLCAALLLSTAHATARTLVLHANGITLDSTGQRQHFSALIIDDAGRIAARVSSFDPQPVPGPTDRVIDAGGKTVLPGLIDAHGHVESLGQQALSLSLTGTRTLFEAQTAIKAYAAAHPGTSWIQGGGWNQVIWGLGRFPTAAELDAAVPGRPAVFERVDGHTLWANSAALKLAGITAQTPDPAGGRIERGAGNAPSGVLVDGAMDLLDAKRPAPTPDEREAAIRAALRIMASVGLTGVGDAGTDPGAWQIYVDLAARHELTARVYAMALGLKSQEAISPRPLPWAFGDHLALMAVKLFADGALGSRGAWLKAPYSDEPGKQGLRFHPDAEMRQMTATAASRGFQVAVHAIGDAANAQVLDSFAAIDPAVRAGLRLRIEHAQVLDPADLPRFASLGVIASMQPTHATSDKNMAGARLGEARLAGAYAWQSLIKSGARYAGGSDFPVEPPNPFYGIHAAVTRQDRQGQPPGGWRDSEALSLDQALAAFTLWSAYANNAERFAGTLEPGKWADFVILDRDPTAVPPTDIWRVKVIETWVGGSKVFP